MLEKIRSSAFLVIGLATFAGCASEQAEEPAADRATTEDALSGGFHPLPTFARDTGTLLIKDNCTAARVGPRHIITAAHCTTHLRQGSYLSITQSPSDLNADWSTIQVARVWVHPSWTAVNLLCGPSLKCSRDYGASDVAVIQTTYDLPNTITSARVGTQRYEANGYLRRVFITGYGCEGGIGGYTSPVRSLGVALSPIEPVSTINNFGPVLTSYQVGPFDGSYLLTPGASHPNGSASLCPGDSGGPLFLDRPVYPGGPGYPTNVVIGINADYTFNGSGLSTFNIHTRLSDDAPNRVGRWLQTVLPESSFFRGINP